MEEFKSWIDRNALVHLPANGVEYTWANGKGINIST